MLQLRGGDQDGEFLGGSYEFIDGRVAEVTPPNTSRKLSLPRSRRRARRSVRSTSESAAMLLGPVAGPKGVVPDFSLAPSPFADPAVQDSEVPYENLPVDKGHLLPPLQELAEKRVSCHTHSCLLAQASTPSGAPPLHTCLVPILLWGAACLAVRDLQLGQVARLLLAPQVLEGAERCGDMNNKLRFCLLVWCRIRMRSLRYKRTADTKKLPHDSKPTESKQQMKCLGCE